MKLDVNGMDNRINDILAKHIPDLFGGQARYTYWQSENKSNKSRARDQYFYTTHKINHRGSPRFVSGVYRYRATDKSWTPMLRAGHAKKKDAIARAKRLKDNNK